MSYNPSHIREVAGRMVDAAFPSKSTPYRPERIAEFEAAQKDLGRLSAEVIFGKDKEDEPHHGVIVPLGIYATRAALESLVRTDKVAFDIAAGVAEEVQTVCTHLRSRITLSGSRPQTMGFAAELGVGNVFCAGIAEEELDLSYAILMGVRGYEKNHSGLKRDVDMVVKEKRDSRYARRKIQIKTSARRARNIYHDDITVITAQDIANTSHAVEAVEKLLKWNLLDRHERVLGYRRIEERLRLAKKKTLR